MSETPPFDWESFLDRLTKFYHRGDWRVPYLRDHAEDPFQVLIGTILSQRTRDENTDTASARLFAKYPDARSLSRATARQIEPLIREIFREIGHQVALPLRRMPYAEAMATYGSDKPDLRCGLEIRDLSDPGLSTAPGGAPR